MKRFALVLVCLLVIGIGTASAGPLNIINIAGVWTSPVGGSNLAGVGTSNVTWGDGVLPDSGYSFAAGPNLIPAPLNATLALGTFTHHNDPIPVGSAITAINLSLSFGTNGSPSTVSAVFTFDHNETPNLTGTSPADDDIVTILAPVVNVPITQGTDLYFFNLLGFSQDGGTTFTNVYRSPEGQNNSTVLYGRLTSAPVGVPEPSSLLLVGAGIFAIGAASWKKRGVNSSI